jgi:hypothetical protein
MTSTLTPACPLCGLRYQSKPLLELHIREDHRQRVPRQHDGHRDPGSTRAAAPRPDSAPDERDLASTPSRTAREATAVTAGHPRSGRAMTALRRALRALRSVNNERLRASEAVIRPARARQPRAPVRPGGKPGKARRRTATERADREACPICQASFPL